MYKNIFIVVLTRSETMNGENFDMCRHKISYVLVEQEVSKSQIVFFHSTMQLFHRGNNMHTMYGRGIKAFTDVAHQIPLKNDQMDHVEPKGYTI